MRKNWLSDLRRHLAWSCAALAIAAGTAGVGRAQEAAPLPPLNSAELQAQIAAQQQQIEELKRLIQSGAVKPAAAEADPKLDDASVKKLVDGYLKEKEDQKKKDDEAAKLKLETEGFKVGSDLKLNARWDYWNGFVVETPNKDFTFHVGGRFQEDFVDFTQTPVLKSTGGVGNFGDLQDGTYFRRIRINMNGTAWQIMEYNMEFALEQVKEGIPTLDEMFVGIKEIPLIGTARVGHMRVAQGFEGDQLSSSKAMTFLEKAYITDALYQNENFAPGILLTNSILDQHMVWMLNAYRSEFWFHNNDGADFGDGKYGFTGRLTFLPIYENEGKHFLHLGASATWRKAEYPDPGLAGPGVIRWRARPSLRDASGDYGGITVQNLSQANFGPTGTVPPNLPGNTARLVDTGNFFANSTTVLGTELEYVCGPFSLQSECAFAWANEAHTTLTGPRSDRGAWGGYIQASYFLTGEHRTYDRRFGREDSNYFSGPRTNFWLTRDENGRLNVGRGAWEIAGRWQILNLNDGPIQGGVLVGGELALNWYLNTNLKVQFEYSDNNRYDRRGSAPGVVQGLGTRVQLNF